ncbi:3-hydroxyacyl-CoA dehydrogenase family protein [Rhodococcus sp. NPDC127530]|uniref:3-hydroxyacyl-CoA dehydrogenase family protein n=1 Tax=unclassified Rhodococcus (in: high G+C Gram-positive bacteria) TaxID=192944 RepID=UPI00363915FA
MAESTNEWTVLVVGAGAMGSQIALVAAFAGHRVRLVDLDAEGLTRAERQLRDRMTAQIAKGRRTVEEVSGAFARLDLHTDLAVAADRVDLVIEAVVEDLEIKRHLFATLGELVAPHTILASNTSSFVPSRLADAAEHPQRFVNLHFFNPALVMKCVEVVRGPETSVDVLTRSVAFVESLGKQPVVLEKEINGFVANRILNAVRDEAIRLYEGGYASVESIDLACRTALGYPMGPFELMDLTGIDIGYRTKKARYAETGDPGDLPSRTVTELVEAGHLGRKSGRGFYTYDTAGA